MSCSHPACNFRNKVQPRPGILCQTKAPLLATLCLDTRLYVHPTIRDRPRSNGCTIVPSNGRMLVAKGKTRNKNEGSGQFHRKEDPSRCSLEHHLLYRTNCVSPQGLIHLAYADEAVIRGRERSRRRRKDSDRIRRTGVENPNAFVPMLARPRVGPTGGCSGVGWRRVNHLILADASASKAIGTSRKRRSRPTTRMKRCDPHTR